MHKKFILASLLIVALAFLAGCTTMRPEVTPVPATKTPKPTFTPTPDWTPTSVVFPTATQPPATNTPEPSPTPAATEVPPTPTAPAVSRFTANQNVNVRSGPGTSYPVVGRMAAGDTYEITGKNEAGDWLQFEANGTKGWVTAGLVTVNGDLGTVSVAAAPPPPTPRPQPTARPQPRPTNPPAQPQPTAVPVSQYAYSKATVASCRPQAAGTWFDGTVKKGGQPVNGALVVFSWSPDASPITNPAVTGPHEGYPGWAPGYFSHIIAAPPEPKAGTWYVWVVDGSGKRISEIASFTSVGPGSGCNEATVVFEG